MMNLVELGAYISGKLNVTNEITFGELTLHAEAANILDVLTFLRDDAECKFVCFIDICGADYPTREMRFDVVYHLLSPYKNTRIRVKVLADEENQDVFAHRCRPGNTTMLLEPVDVHIALVMCEFFVWISCSKNL